MAFSPETAHNEPTLDSARKSSAERAQAEAAQRRAKFELLSTPEQAAATTRAGESAMEQFQHPTDTADRFGAQFGPDAAQFVAAGTEQFNTEAAQAHAALNAEIAAIGAGTDNVVNIADFRTPREQEEVEDRAAQTPTEIIGESERIPEENTQEDQETTDQEKDENQQEDMDTDAEREQREKEHEREALEIATETQQWYALQEQSLKGFTRSFQVHIDAYKEKLRQQIQVNDNRDPALLAQQRLVSRLEQMTTGLESPLPRFAAASDEAFASVESLMVDYQSKKVDDKPGDWRNLLKDVHKVHMEFQLPAQDALQSFANAFTHDAPGTDLAFKQEEWSEVTAQFGPSITEFALLSGAHSAEFTSQSKKLLTKAETPIDL